MENTTTFNLPIFQEQIDGDRIQTVNARDLHRELESGYDFSDWIKKRVTDYSFIDGEDFTSFLWKSGIGRPTKEYHLSLDMAKELSMVEKTGKGKQVRRFFIQKEKESRQLSFSGHKALSPVLQDCLVIAQTFGLSGNQALLSASNGTEQLTGQNPAKLIGLELKAESKAKIFTPTELGKAFLDGMSGRKLNTLLAKAGLQERIEGQWELTEAGKLYAEVLDTGKRRSTGTPVKQIKWFKGVVGEVTV